MTVQLKYYSRIYEYYILFYKIYKNSSLIITEQKEYIFETKIINA